LQHHYTKYDLTLVKLFTVNDIILSDHVKLYMLFLLSCHAMWWSNFISVSLFFILVF